MKLKDWIHINMIIITCSNILSHGLVDIIYFNFNIERSYLVNIFFQFGAVFKINCIE